MAQSNEKKRWLKNGSRYCCPDCRVGFLIDESDMPLFHHCPKCGIEMIPPESLKGAIAKYKKEDPQVAEWLEELIELKAERFFRGGKYNVE